MTHTHPSPVIDESHTTIGTARSFAAISNIIMVDVPHLVCYATLVIIGPSCSTIRASVWQVVAVPRVMTVATALFV